MNFNGPAELAGDREIFIEREFDAPRGLVWRAWTEPEHIAQWWGPNGFRTTVHSMDVRVGGEFVLTMRGPDGREYPNKIRYSEVVAEEKLMYTHGGANAEVTVTFEEAGGKTRLKMRMVFPSAEARDHVVKTYKAVEGMTQTIGRLGEHLLKM
jgi:uncharacterized protein YndB with AHSA1/START domain